VTKIDLGELKDFIGTDTATLVQIELFEDLVHESGEKRLIN